MTMQTKRRERGVALIMVLLIITLMLILVVEFTYTVQVETHISRNALNSLQATYLARSGINLLAGALLEDKDKDVDPGENDAWRLYATGGCQTIPPEKPSFWQPGWQLCGRIVVESGKININLSRPQANAPISSLQGAQATPGSGQNKECVPNQQNSWPYCYRDIIAKIVASKAGVEEDDVRQVIDNYWAKTQSGKLGQASGAQDFDSLEDAASAMPMLQNRAIFDSIRNYLTAAPTGNNPNAGNSPMNKVNFLTAPPFVLRAIMTVSGSDESAVDEIVTARQDASPPQNCNELLKAVTGTKTQFVTRICGLQSSMFRLEASAVSNGVGKTIRALVFRRPIPKKGKQDETQSFQLEYRDWAKESGIGAAVEAANDEGEGLEPGDNSDKDED